MLADLVYKRLFTDPKVWKRCLGVYLSGWLPHGSEEGDALAEQARQHFNAIDKVSVILSDHICLRLMMQ